MMNSHFVVESLWSKLCLGHPSALHLPFLKEGNFRVTGRSRSHVSFYGCAGQRGSLKKEFRWRFLVAAETTIPGSLNLPRTLDFSPISTAVS